MLATREIGGRVLRPELVVGLSIIVGLELIFRVHERVKRISRDAIEGCEKVLEGVTRRPESATIVHEEVIHQGNVVCYGPRMFPQLFLDPIASGTLSRSDHNEQQKGQTSEIRPVCQRVLSYRIVAKGNV